MQMKEVVLLEYDNHIIGMYCSFNDSTIISVASTRYLYAHRILILIAQNMID